MNTVCIVIGIVFFICVIMGWARGLFRVLISVAGLIVSIIVAAFVAPAISNYIHNNTKWDEQLSVVIAEKLELSDKEEETSKGVQISIIDELPLPDSMKNDIMDNNNLETYDILKATGVYDYIAKSVAVIIINGAVFLITISLCRLIFLFLGRLAKGIDNIPIIGEIDKTGGALLGGIKGLILIWIFFLILSLTSTFEWSRNLTEDVCRIELLKLLFENNILLDIVEDLTKVLFP